MAQYSRYPSNSFNQGPEIFVLNGANQNVTQDTVTPANNKPFPVSIVDTSGNINKVTITASVMKEVRFDDASSVNINGSGGAFVEVGGSNVPIANTISQIQFSSTLGEPVTIRKAANAGAAAAAADLFIINQGGGPATVGVALVAGDKLWIRSLSTLAMTTGYLTLNLMG